MTVGYPDWQAFPNSSGPPFAAQTAFPLSATNPFSAAGFITNYPSLRLRIRVSGSTQGCAVTLSYFTDASQTLALGSYSWTLGPAQTLAALAPNLGAYAVLSVTSSDPTVRNTIIEAIPFVLAPYAVRYLGVGNECSLLNVTVAISGTTSVRLPQVAEGPGYLMVQPQDTLGKLVIQVWELGQDGSQVVKVAELSGLTGPAYAAIYGSSSGLQLTVNNTDAGATHALYARLCVDGR